MLHNKKALETFNIIGLADTNWHGLWMNRQQILSRLGKVHTVVYSNGPLETWHWSKASKQRPWQSKQITVDNITLHMPPKWALTNPRLPLLNGLIYKKIEHDFATVFNDNTDHITVLYVFHPRYLDMVKHIAHDLLIYHCYDNHALMTDSDPSLLIQEEQLCKTADLVFTSSEATRHRFITDYGCERAHFIPNGVDYPLFSETPAKTPGFLEAFSQREGLHIGYIGSINEKLDFELILWLTNSMHDANFVFIGRVNNLSEKDAQIWRDIIESDNVFYHPGCERQQVPEILKTMDVNAIYYQVAGDSFAKDGYPLKLHECLATGKPVVGAGIDSIASHKDVVLVPDNKEEWRTYLYQAGNHPESSPSSTEQRLAVAKENSWDKVVQGIEEALQQAIKNTSPN